MDKTVENEMEARGPLRRATGMRSVGLGTLPQESRIKRRRK